MQPIAPYGLTPPFIAGPVPLTPTEAPTAPGFQDALWQALSQANSINSNAQQTVEQSLVGEDFTMIESFTAVREADLALRMMIQIRNKLLDAYQEIQQLRM